MLNHLERENLSINEILEAGSDVDGDRRVTANIVVGASLKIVKYIKRNFIRNL